MTFFVFFCALQSFYMYVCVVCTGCGIGGHTTHSNIHGAVSLLHHSIYCI